MTDREQLYEAFDNGIIGLDDIIDISQKDGYNQALDDISEKIKWQYKNYKSMPSIHLFLEIVEQLKK